MKEDFLHYAWRFKKFNVLGLSTVNGESLEVLGTGQYWQQAGPDFFDARLIIGGQLWAGNVEMHVRSSDWYLHRHEADSHYDNVILHVVWEHDAEVLRQDNSEIPVLELRHYVDADILQNYNALAAAKSWIYCEKELETLNGFVLDNWKERLFFERLERKALPILQLASETGNDWEAVLFCFLAKGFGLNTNGNALYAMARSVPFGIVRKESFGAESAEALFFGRAGLLSGPHEDLYFKTLKSHYDYICQKYRLEAAHVDALQFFRLRPDNFPTIRLSQLAQLYHHRQHLFDKIITAPDIDTVYSIFSIGVHPYWQTHYRFDKESAKKRKMLSKSFIDLLIINVIVPFRFAYSRSIGRDQAEQLMALLQAVGPESNSIIDKFRAFRVPVASAYDSQSLLQLKNEYCAHKRCLQCALGLELLKK